MNSTVAILEWMDEHLTPMACGVPTGEASLDAFHIYPNPAQDFIVLSGEPEGQNILIYNTLGEEMYRAVFDKTDLQLAVKSWPRGVYFVELRAKGGKRVYKLLME